MKKKILLLTLILIILLTNFAFAANATDVKMEVVKEPVCTINLENNSSFEKKLISKDLTNKEVTIQLKITAGEYLTKPTGEMVLLLDNSYSMEDLVQEGVTRKNLIFNSAKTLLTNALKDNDSLKVAISTFSTNTDVSKEGTIEDAQKEIELTNDLDSLLTTIDNINAEGYRTNLDAGLKVAKSQFSQEQNNKYLIVLTDGVPNVAVDYDNSVFSDDVINKTKAELETFKTNGINLVTMLTGVANEDATPLPNRPTYKEIITSIFGTSQAPTVGSFYYIVDRDVEETIVNHIYQDLIPVVEALTNIKIVDYFPQEIIDNFDFAYVTNTDIGEISATVDKTNNSITWTIPKLESSQTSTVQYKLKLKNKFNDTIIDKLINTNKKVDITYTDFTKTNQSKTSDVTPVVKLTKITPPVLPKAGTEKLVILSILAIGLVIFTAFRFTILNKRVK